MNIGGHFKRHMAAGIVTIVPLVVTGLFVWWLVGRTEFVSDLLYDKGIIPCRITGIGLIVSLVVSLSTIYFIGLVMSNIVGRKFLQLGEAVIERVPIVKTIYTTTKQIADSVSLSKKGLFQKVILFEYPKEGVWTIGFVTGIVKGEIQKRVPERLMNVFVPTTPNPTSGYLLMVPEESLISTALTVEEAMRIIVSGGIASSPAETRLGETLLATKDDLEDLIAKRSGDGDAARDRGNG